MSPNRNWLWGALLLVGLVLHWWDPVPRRDRAPPSGVVQAAPSHSSTTQQGEPVDSKPTEPTRGAQWKATRDAKTRMDVADLFTTRSAVMILEAQKIAAKRKPPPPQPVVRWIPETPPAPQEAAPPVKAIGTWRAGTDAAVFLGTPTGTVLAKQGSVVLGMYQVTQLDSGQLILVNQQTQRAWPIAVPSAPTSLQTWPMKSTQ